MDTSYHSRFFRILRLASVLGVFAAPTASSQSSSPFDFHGYLTQAYGASSGDMVLGLTDRGTADYRRAAVLARFTPTNDDALVVQLAHRRLGASPTMQFESEVKLDMAFY